MTKQDFQKELKEKVKEGIKPSNLKKLKKSKSLDDIPTSSSNPPLPRSKSQLEIPFSNQPSKDQQISSLQDELTTERKKVSLLREDLSNSQQKNKQLKKTNQELEDNILQLRVEKIKEFGEYQEKKQELETELELNINTGIKEIQRLEKQLKTVNQKKLTLQQQLGQELSQNARLESKLLEQEPSHLNYWPLLMMAGLGLALWLFNNQKQ